MKRKRKRAREGDSFFMVTEETSSRFLTFFTASVKLLVYRVIYIQACLTAFGAQKHGFFRGSAVSPTISSPCFFNTRQEQDRRKFRVYFTSRSANGVPLYYSGRGSTGIGNRVKSSFVRCLVVDSSFSGFRLFLLPLLLDVIHRLFSVNRRPRKTWITSRAVKVREGLVLPNNLSAVRRPVD